VRLRLVGQCSRQGQLPRRLERTPAGRSRPTSLSERAKPARGAPHRQVESSLPTTRAELMALHAAARARREASALGSDAYRAAAEEIARIEVQIARIEEPPPPA
jgi:hypothetical protein